MRGNVYWELLRQPTIANFTVAGAVARLPVAMVALGIVLLVSNATGSYGAAGAMSALYAIGSATVSIATSRWADRSGQVITLRSLSIAHSISLLTFTGSVLLQMPILLSWITAALAGATCPSVGSFVRARWACLAPDASRLRTGFAWEGVVDEFLFTVGPLLTVALAFGVGLPVPLVLAALLVLLGSMWLAAAKSSIPPPTAQTAGASLVHMLRTTRIGTLALACVCLGSFFGTLDVTAVAFTAQQGVPALAGLVLAAFAAGSMVSGLAYGMRNWRVSLGHLTQRFALGLAATSPLLLVARSTALLTIAAIITGIAAAPTLTGLFSLAERSVSTGNLTEGLTWCFSGLIVGFAVGSWVSGVTIDLTGVLGGFVVSCISSVGLFAVVTVFVRMSRSQPEPGASSTH